MANGAKIRATFEIKFNGDLSEMDAAVQEIGQLLNERYSLSYDEDFIWLHGGPAAASAETKFDRAWSITGIRLMTLEAVKAVIEVLPEITSVYMIETENALLEEELG